MKITFPWEKTKKRKSRKKETFKRVCDQVRVISNGSYSTKEDRAEASGKGIDGGQKIRISEAPITLVNRRGQRFRSLLEKLISINIADAEFFGDLGPTGGMDDRDFVRVLGCSSEELV